MCNNSVRLLPKTSGVAFDQTNPCQCDYLCSCQCDCLCSCQCHCLYSYQCHCLCGYLCSCHYLCQCHCLCSVSGVIRGVRTFWCLHVSPPLQHSGDADRCQHQSGVLWRLLAHAWGANRRGMYKVGGMVITLTCSVVKYQHEPQFLCINVTEMEKI